MSLFGLQVSSTWSFLANNGDCACCNFAPATLIGSRAHFAGAQTSKAHTNNETHYLVTFSAPTADLAPLALLLLAT